MKNSFKKFYLRSSLCFLGIGVIMLPASVMAVTTTGAQSTNATAASSTVDPFSTAGLSSNPMGVCSTSPNAIADKIKSITTNRDARIKAYLTNITATYNEAKKTEAIAEYDKANFVQATNGTKIGITESALRLKLKKYDDGSSKALASDTAAYEKAKTEAVASAKKVDAELRQNFVDRWSNSSKTGYLDNAAAATLLLGGKDGLGDKTGAIFALYNVQNYDITHAITDACNFPVKAQREAKVKTAVTTYLADVKPLNKAFVDSRNKYYLFNKTTEKKDSAGVEIRGSVATDGKFYVDRYANQVARDKILSDYSASYKKWYTASKLVLANVKKLAPPVIDTSLVTLSELPTKDGKTDAAHCVFGIYQIAVYKSPCEAAASLKVVKAPAKPLHITYVGCFLTKDPADATLKVLVFRSYYIYQDLSFKIAGADVQSHNITNTELCSRPTATS